MNNLKSALFVFCLLLAIVVQAQTDIIYTKKGEKIVCKIERVDSSKVYFKIPGADDVQATLPGEEVKSIEYNRISKEEAPKIKPSKTTDQKQEVKSKVSKLYNFLAVHGGLCQPVGAFANADLNNSSSGFAKSSYFYGASLTFLSKKIIGLTFNVMSGSNGFNASPLQSFANEQTGSVWKADKAYWKSVALNAGIVMYHDIDDIRIQGRVGAGVLILNSPLVNIYINQANWIRQNSAQANALCYSAGGSVSYELTEKVSFALDLDFYTSTVKFAEISSLTSAGSATSVKDVTQPFSILCAGLGMYFHF